MARTGSIERVPSSENPKQAASYSTARNIVLERVWLVGPLLVGVSYGIVFPGKINDRICGIASTGYIQFVVDNSIRKATPLDAEMARCG